MPLADVSQRHLHLTAVRRPVLTLFRRSSWTSTLTGAQQVALAWELAQSPVVIPIPGAKRPESIRDSASAADLSLTQEELKRLSDDDQNG